MLTYRGRSRTDVDSRQVAARTQTDMLQNLSTQALPSGSSRAKINAVVCDLFVTWRSVYMGAQTSPSARGTRSASRSVQQKSRPVPPALIDQDLRRELIAQAAYYRAQRRGFAPGHEAEDWLAAESEVDTALMLGALPLNT